MSARAIGNPARQPAEETESEATTPVRYIRDVIFACSTSREKSYISLPNQIEGFLPQCIIPRLSRVQTRYGSVYRP